MASISPARCRLRNLAQYASALLFFTLLNTNAHAVVPPEPQHVLAALRTVDSVPAAQRNKAMGALLALLEKRHAALYELAIDDPARTLQLALPPYVLEKFTVAAKPQLERWFHGFVALDVLPDLGEGVAYIRLPDQRSFRVQLWGRRSKILSQPNVPVSALLVGDRAVLFDSPLAPALLGETLADAVSTLWDAASHDPLLPGAQVYSVAGQNLSFNVTENARSFESRMLAEERRLGGRSRARQLMKSALSAQPLRQPLVSPASAHTEGSKTLLFLRLHFPDLADPPVDAQLSQQQLDGPVRTAIERNSFGLLTINSTVSSESVLLPRSSTVYTSNPGLLFQDALTAFRDQGTGLDPNAFDFVAVHFPRIGYRWAGLATLGGRSSWLNGSIDTGLIVHELGHNLGLDHAGSWTSLDLQVGGAGFREEYGDRYDVMGSGSGELADYQPYLKWQLDWLPTSQILDTAAAGPGVHRIYRFDAQDAIANPYLAMRANKCGDGEYWLGLRKNFVDNPALSSGAYVTWLPNFETRPLLLDTTPGTAPFSYNDLEDAALVPGSSFTDPRDCVRFTTLAAGGTPPNEWIDVEVAAASYLAVTQSGVQGALPQPGANFVLSTTVTNAGALSTGSTSAVIRRATGPTVKPTSRSVSEISLPPLTPGESVSLDTQLQAPVGVGSEHYALCFSNDTLAGGSREDCGRPVAISAPQLRFLNERTEPEVVQISDAYSYTAELANLGFVAARNLEVDYRLVIDNGNAPRYLLFLVQRFVIPVLGPGEVRLFDFPGLQGAEGTVGHELCVREGNLPEKCTNGVTVSTGESNLTLRRMQIPQGRVLSGQALTVSVEAANVGDVGTEAGFMRFVAGLGQRVRGTDREMARADVVPLAPQATDRISRTLTMDLSPGQYFLGGCANQVPSESTLLNNCSRGVPVEVVAANGEDALRVAVGSRHGEFDQPGQTDWAPTSTGGREGAPAALVTGLAAGSTGTLSAMFNGPGLLRFDWRLDGSGGDALVLLLNGIEQQRLVGGADWRTSTLPIMTGDQLVEWRFVPSSDGDGMNAEALLSSVEFEPLPAAQAPTALMLPPKGSWLPVKLRPQQPAFFRLFAVEGRRYAFRLTAVGLGLNIQAELTLDGELIAAAAAVGEDLLEFQAQRSGTYFLKLYDSAGNSGEFAVSASEVRSSLNPNVALVSSVLPASRSITVNSEATAFASIINTGSAVAEGCTVSPDTALPLEFFYQLTDPATNATVGERNPLFDLAPGELQTLVFGFRAQGSFASQPLALRYDCVNSDGAESILGLNTLRISASGESIPDVIALAATPSNDGIVALPSLNGSNVFSLASANVGATGELTVTADTGSAELPLDILLCETNPASGVCVNPTSPTSEAVTTTIAAGGTPTFALFVTARGPVALDPASRRIFVRFRDREGIIRGSSSVAVATPPGEEPVPRRLRLDFDQVYDGTLTDGFGQGIGFTHRLPGTGSSLSAIDDQLILDTDVRVLRIASTASDLNGQGNLAVAEFPGFRLSDFGFTGTENFLVFAVFTDIQYNANFDQFGVYVGSSSDTAFRAGGLFTGSPTIFNVSTSGGFDRDLRLLAGPAPGSSLGVTLARIDGVYKVAINNTEMEVVQPSFQPGEDLFVGVFTGHPGNSETKFANLAGFILEVE